MNMDDFIRDMEATTGIFDEFQKRIFADMGYGGSYRSSSGERIHFTPDPRTDDYTNTKITTKKPREGYIDAGIVLTKGFFITREQFEDMELYEWEQIKDWAESMDNIRVDELVRDSFTDGRLLWIYDAVPNITSLR